jgi:large subunit ribosomal protein L18
MKNRNKNRIFRFNRRIRGLTNYPLRLRLLKSEMPRIVVRKSNKNTLVQIVEYASNGDKVITSAKSCDLRGFSYKGSYSNLSAAYLTGLLVGKKAQKIGFKKECIVDLGLQKVIPKSKIFAAVKGVLDSGLNVRVSEDIFPDEERISGNHLSIKDGKKMIENTKKAIEGMK